MEAEAQRVARRGGLARVRGSRRHLDVDELPGPPRLPAALRLRVPTERGGGPGRGLCPGDGHGCVSAHRRGRRLPVHEERDDEDEDEDDDDEENDDDDARVKGHSLPLPLPLRLAVAVAVAATRKSEENDSGGPGC